MSSLPSQSLSITLTTVDLPWLIDLDEITCKQQVILYTTMGKKIYDQCSTSTLSLQMGQDKIDLKEISAGLLEKMDALVRTNGSTNKKLSTQMTDHQSQITDLITQQQSALSKITINSYKKGAFKEQEIFTLLQTHLYDRQVILVNKQPHSGDILVVGSHSKTMLEIKNYEGTLPQKQVDKFYSDVKTSDCDSAILISRSAISNKKKIDYEVRDSKPVFTIVLDDQIPFITVVYILLLMDTLVPILTNSTITTIQKDYIVDHIEAICGSTTKVMDEMITTRSVIEECKKSITTLQNQLTMLEMKMREQGTLLGVNIGELKEQILEQTFIQLDAVSLDKIVKLIAKKNKDIAMTIQQFVQTAPTLGYTVLQQQSKTKTKLLIKNDTACKCIISTTKPFITFTTDDELSYSGNVTLDRLIDQLTI